MSIEVNAWKCEKCGKAYLNKLFADDCCKEKPLTTCRVCGKLLDSPKLICHSCHDKERFEKAKKVKYSEYKIGFLWDENKQEYFSDKDVLEEKYEDDVFGTDEEPEYPTWCYGCIEIPFKINIDGAIEQAEENMYDDFDARHDTDDLYGLLAFVEKWNVKQTAKAYETDYSTVILLNE